MKVHQTQVVSYTPKKAKTLGMTESGFPLFNGEPMQMDDNNIVELDGVLYVYDGEDEWSLAIDGVHYSSKHEVIDIIKINQEFYTR